MCVLCNASDEQFNADGLPTALEPAKRVAPEYSVYQVTGMLRGVIERGTATSVGRIMGDRPVAGKTGTTNEARDAWFIGYTPDLVVGVFVGFDTPKPLGDREGGGRAASPIFANFMSKALAGTEIIPFRPPDGVPERYLDPVTGTIDVTQMAQDGRVIVGDELDSVLPPTVPNNDDARGISNGNTGNRSDVQTLNPGSTINSLY